MGELTASNATCADSAGTSSPSCDTEPADGAEPLLTRAETAPSAQPYSASTASGDGGTRSGRSPTLRSSSLSSGPGTRRPWSRSPAQRGKQHDGQLISAGASPLFPALLQERAQRRGLATRAGERPAPWTLPQNLIDEARALADGRIPLPEPERVPWDVLIAQAVNWDIPQRLAA